jgi:F-type H+-transporting ATPase subunit b
MSFFATPEFWVGVSFATFFAILGYYGVHKTLLASLDARSDAIAAEIAAAEQLRIEAEALLKDAAAAEAQAKAEAAALVEQAKVDAERMKLEAKAKLEDFVARRTQAADSRIAQAEAKALADVRAAAVDLATRASTLILEDVVDKKANENLVKAALAEVPGALH